MKKIEAVIPHARLERVFAALKDLNLGGVTYFESKGRGEVPRPKIHSGRGTGTYTPEFNVNSTIMIVVKESMVNSVVDKILEGASSGLKGEGKIFVSDVDDVVDIGTKKRGESTI
jgi:nitrogen regulatory protein P-II 1